VALSADGSRAIVSALFGDTAAGGDTGSAHVFVRDGTSWTEAATLVAPDGATNDFFSNSVALSADGTLAIIAAPSHDTAAGTDAGSAYVFALAPPLCPTDANDVGCAAVPACAPGTCAPIDIGGGAEVVRGITVTFNGNVTSSGTIVNVQSGTGSPPGPLPSGYKVLSGSTGLYYFDINTTATYSGPIVVCMGYAPAALENGCDYAGPLPAPAKNELRLRLLHDAGSGFMDITIPFASHGPYSDPCANRICGQTTSLSPFVIAEPVDTTAPIDGIFFLQPINPDGSSVFKLGSTIPVKFKLTGVSAGITNLAAHLSVAKISNSVTGSYVEAASPGAANAGSTFRYDTDVNLYIFNLSTKALSAGTWSLRADLGDRVDHTINVSLR